MQIQVQPMGEYQTNCYIVTINGKDFIVDPGMGATNWVIEHAKNPVAILNTHGHFDHVWSNSELQKLLQIPIVIHQNDAFFLQRDQFGINMPKSEPNLLVKDEEPLSIEGESIRFLHFPGHTPGSCVIDFGEFWCSGDFIFKGSIGRVDFPYSDPNAMKESLRRFKALEFDKILYPGHGEPTTIKEEQRLIDYWLRAI